jgi:hypothetical protein
MWIFHIIKGNMIYLLVLWYGDEDIIPHYIALLLGIKPKKMLKSNTRNKNMKRVNLKI